MNLVTDGTMLPSIGDVRSDGHTSAMGDLGHWGRLYKVSETCLRRFGIRILQRNAAHSFQLCQQFPIMPTVFEEGADKLAVGYREPNKGTSATRQRKSCLYKKTPADLRNLADPWTLSPCGMCRDECSTSRVCSGDPMKKTFLQSSGS